MKNTIIEVLSNQYKKEFYVQRFKNNSGHSHLVVIVQPATQNIEIGTVILIPYAEGFKDPCKVLLQVDKNGIPKMANMKFGIVLEYIYE